MSGLSVAVHYDHGANAEREHLLAVWELRGSLECLQKGGQAVSAGALRRELEELIAALDRRVPRVEQAGEAAIAREAASLRAKAVARLAELARDASISPVATGAIAGPRPRPIAK
jgi:hypothetical protein